MRRRVGHDTDSRYVAGLSNVVARAQIVQNDVVQCGLHQASAVEVLAKRGAVRGDKSHLEGVCGFNHVRHPERLAPPRNVLLKGVFEVLPRVATVVGNLHLPPVRGRVGACCRRVGVPPPVRHDGVLVRGQINDRRHQVVCPPSTSLAPMPSPSSPLSPVMNANRRTLGCGPATAPPRWKGR